jgi:hypothetical protein
MIDQIFGYPVVEVEALYPKPLPSLLQREVVLSELDMEHEHYIEHRRKLAQQEIALRLADLIADGREYFVKSLPEITRRVDDDYIRNQVRIRLTTIAVLQRAEDAQVGECCLIDIVSNAAELRFGDGRKFSRLRVEGVDVVIGKREA